MPGPNTKFLGKLGKGPVRYDKRTLKLSKYLKVLAPAPPKASYVQMVKNWPMMLNDMLGDCVIAAAGHIIQQVTTYGGNPVVPSDSAILRGYMDVGGYIPGDPSTDNGCIMLDGLNYWRQKGIAGHKIVAYVALEPGNMRQLKQAISIFGNVYMGIQLPVTAQEQPECWSVVPDGGQWALPGSWGGHCVPGMMYDPAQPNSANMAQDSTIGFISWGQLMWMTTSMYKTYVDEAYAVLDADFLGTDGKTPAGLDLNQLLADLAEITA